MRLAERLGDPLESYEAAFKLGDAYLINEWYKLASVAYCWAVESTRAALLEEQATLDYFSEPRVEVYDRLVRIHALLLHEPREGWQWLERYRGRGFLSLLRQSGLRPAQTMPRDLVSEEQRLLSKWKIVQRDISDNQQMAGIERREFLETQLRELWARMEQCDSEYVSLRHGQPVSWNDVRECLQQ